MNDTAHTFVFEEALVTVDSAKAGGLRRKATPVTFPLTSDVQDICTILEKEIIIQDDGVGFAANQLGFEWNITVINVPDPAISGPYRDDHVEFFQGILINPTYQGMGHEKREDWESCFSIPGVTGKVSRYVTIQYTYQDKTGKTITTKATGFLARVIQHEIDHLNGILWTDLVAPENIVVRKEKPIEIENAPNK